MNSIAWAWTALAVYLAGLLLAFGVRTWVQIRSTGTSGFRGISGRPGSLAWWGGVLFPLASLLLLAAPVLVLTGSAAPLTPLALPAVAILGLVLAASGLAVVLAAQAAMGSSWRIGVDDDERTDLVTTSLFGTVRNPIFTGITAVAAGVALMTPTPVALLAVVLVVAAVQIQVRVVEEPYLRRVHGDAYIRYANHAGRFLPGLGRLSPDAEGRPTSPAG